MMLRNVLRWPDHRRIGLSLVFVFLAGAVVPGSRAQSPEPAPALRVLAFADPLSKFMHETDDGGFDGFDYQLMKSFAASLNRELEIIPVEPFDDLLPALVRGEGDIAVGSITITADREELVDFSVPYFPVLQWIVAPGHREEIQSLDELDGWTGSAVPGTSFHGLLESVEGVRILSVDSTQGMYETVATGEADFTVDETISALVVLPDYPELKRIFELPTVQHYGFALPPGSDLREELDRFLNETASGDSYYRSILRYLGPAGVEAFKRARGAS